MQANQIQDLLQQHFGSQPGFDAGGAQHIATTLATASAVLAQQAGAAAVTQPTAAQQQCYARCQQTRDASLAAAALEGWPAGTIAAAAAITAFNACRHQCDQNAR